MRITINGKGHDIPTRWEEVTFAQFLDITERPNKRLDLLAYFTGIPPDELKAAKITDADGVIRVLSFIDREINYIMPQKCRGYTIPQDLENEAIGAYDDLRTLLDSISQKDPKEIVKHYPLMVATYTCAQAYGRPYDWKDAETLAPYFMDAPAPEVLAIGNFTLVKLTALKLGRKIPSLRAPILKTRLGRAWINLRQTLSSITRYFGWRARQALDARS